MLIHVKHAHRLAKYVNFSRNFRHEFFFLSHFEMKPQVYAKTNENAKGNENNKVNKICTF